MEGPESPHVKLDKLKGTGGDAHVQRAREGPLASRASAVNK